MSKHLVIWLPPVGFVSALRKASFFGYFCAFESECLTQSSLTAEKNLAANAELYRTHRIWAQS